MVKFFVLILLSFTLFINAVSFTYAESPGFKDNLLLPTRTEKSANAFLNPALFGFNKALRFSFFAGFENDSDYGKSFSLSSTFLGFGLKYDYFYNDNFLIKKLVIGHGFKLTEFLLFGYSYSWYYSKINKYNNLESLDLGISLFISSFLHLSYSLKDIVMSDYSYGLLEPEQTLGIGVRLFDNRILLHSDHNLKKIGVFIRPIDGLSLGFKYFRNGNEDSYSLSIGIDFPGITFETSVSKSKDIYNGYNSIQINAEKQRSIIPNPDRFLVVDIIGNFPEDPGIIHGSVPFLTQKRKNTFLNLLMALHKASKDKKIKIIYLRIYPHNLGFGRTEELIETLNLCKKSGKQIIAYIEYGSSKSYAIASTAEKIFLNPNIHISMKGVGVVVTFIKGFLDKIGLKANLFYMGKYKSAAQLATLTKMTKEHKEAQKRIVSEMYNFLINTISKNKKLKINRVKTWFSKGLILPQQSVKLGLVNGLKDEQETQRYVLLKGLSGVKLYKYFNETFDNNSWSKKPQIGVVHITGTIVNSKSSQSPNPVYGSKSAGSDTIIPWINLMGASYNIKAVVIRVQSGGGDLLASSKIWKAVNRLRKIKPVFISMGDVAASGGYYLSCGTKNKKSIIFAPRTCITGSIGVITGKLVVAKLKKKIGFNTYFVKKGKFPFLWSANRRFSIPEEALIKKSLANHYNTFLKVVSEGRSINLNKIKNIAGGRIWSGRDAFKLNLIDGNLTFLEVLLLAGKSVGLGYNKFSVLEGPVHRLDLLKLLKTPVFSFNSFLKNHRIMTSLLTGNPLAIIPFYIEYQ
ncbi:MAG: S49 family peptidase [Spirochaetes bacterium]|nr:S49 family peptidase [Spirochaetota bacterium]